MSYDLDAIRQTISLSDLAIRYGVKLSREGQREWKGCCPFHKDDTPSFTIFLGREGVQRFKCFGCGEHGDAIDFVRKMEDCSLQEACAMLVGDRETGKKKTPEPVKRLPERGIYDDLVVGSSDIVPKVGEAIALWNPKRGKYGKFTPTHVWHYPGHGYVVRRSMTDGHKDYSQIRVSQHGWTRWPFDRPRPLYGHLEGKGNIVVVEGEKACDALMAAKPHWRVVTWPGGTPAVQYADWRALSGEKAVLWADHDAPGSKCMATLQGILTKSECRCVVLDTFEVNPEEHESGWDVADLEGDPALYLKTHLSNGHANGDDTRHAAIEAQHEAHAKAGGVKVEKKKRRPVLLNAVEYIEANKAMDGFVKFNEFSQQMMLMRPIPHPRRPTPKSFVPHVWKDADTLAMMQFLQAGPFVMATKGLAEDVKDEIGYRHHYHPVRDYLDKRKWDGTLRLHHWLETALHAERTTIEQDAYVQAVARCTLISAVARIYKPGCKSDSMLILESPEGQFKSSVIRALCPDPSWFSEDMPPISSHGMKESQEHLLGHWLIEMPELTAIRRSDVEHLKAFLTTCTDSFRSPFGRRTEAHPRQCVFFGTTNSTNYMAREDGNRRFWPVCVKDIDVEWVEQNRDQLWAEAVAAFKAGEGWWLTGEVALAAREEQRQRRQVDPWENPVREIMRTLTGPITVDQLLSQMGHETKEQTKSAEMRVTVILKDIGWKKQRVMIRGEQANRWYPPEKSHLRLVTEDEL